MSNILLTGGRTSAALTLARAFHKAGHWVAMAESLRGHLSQPSNAIDRNFTVPSPRHETGAFTRTLIQLIVENKIDVLIPTFEEAFYVAMAHDQLPCPVFTESFKNMNIVRNKWFFVVTAIEFELFAPETMLIINQDDLLQAFAQWRELDLKPVYPRFSTPTLRLPTLRQALSTLKHESSAHWIAQEHLPGQKYGTYSICHDGHITAHTTYVSHSANPPEGTQGLKHVDHPGIFNWVKTYIEKQQWTGQIAFRFVETNYGRLSAMECIPHATDGLHLLASNPEFVDAFFDPQMSCINPLDLHSAKPASPVSKNILARSVRQEKLGRRLSTFFTGEDAIWDSGDPLPLLLYFRSILAYMKLARMNKIPRPQALTFDIEWNGELSAA